MSKRIQDYRRIREEPLCLTMKVFLIQRNLAIPRYFNIAETIHLSRNCFWDDH